jgi:putative oxidoreductase
VQPGGLAEHPSSMSRLRTCLVWSATVFVTVYFILASIRNIGDAAAKEGLWKHSDWLRLFVGVVEIVGGVLILLPRAATGAAAVLAIIMIGAIYALFRVQDDLRVVLPALVLWMLIYIGYTRYSQSPWGKRA